MKHHQRKRRRTRDRDHQEEEHGNESNLNFLVSDKMQRKVPHSNTNLSSLPKTKAAKIKAPYKLMLLCAVACAAVATTTASVVAEAVTEPTAAAPLHSITSQKQHSPEEENTKQESGGIIVIATVDGTLAGLSKSTGETIWKLKSPSSLSSSSQKTNGDECHDHNMRPTTPHRSTGGAGTTAKEEEGRKEAEKLLAPLVSTTTTTKSSSFHSLGADWRTAAVPSVDGRVYLTTNHKKGGGSNTDSSSTTTDDGSGGDVTATAMVRELVHKSPFVDNQGRRFYVGSRTASAAALDVDTGEILRLVGGDGPYIPHGYGKQKREDDHDAKEEVDDNENDIEDDERASSLENRNVVWVGRVDYTVSIYDTRTADLDVQFSTSEVLSVNDMVQGGGGSSGHMIGAGGGFSGFPPEMSLEMFHSNGAGLGQGASFQKQLMRNKGFTSGDNSASSSSTTTSALASSGLIATPNGNIAFLNPSTNTIDWVANEAFDTPVAFAIESDTGMSLGVDIIPDVPLPNKFQSKEYMSRELIRRFKEIDDGSGGVENEYNNRGVGVDETIVGALKSGQLFAMPLGGTRNSNAGGTQGSGRHSSSSAATKRNPTLPSLPQPPAFKQSSLYSSKDTGGGAETTKSGIINKQSKPNFLFDQEKKKVSDKTKENNERMKQPTKPFLHDPNQQKQEQQQQQDQYEDYLATIPHYYDHQHQYRYQYGGQQQKRGKFHTFFMIMTSWIPPAVALAFVVSFELGRRERLRAENITFVDEDTSSSLTSSSAALNKNARSVLSPARNRKRNESLSENSLFVMNSSNGGNRSDGGQRKTNNNIELISDDDNDDSSSIRNVGVIQITNEVLGYGGHGTVVYRGKLDGRNVAVKRMLKTYHASAEREISLLIESDGHPNVVRYFLKEVRDDFVYLALELCDMSLHDLIVTLCKRKNSCSLGKNYVGDGRIPAHNDKNQDFGASVAFSTGVSAATKSTLLQIASGVRHLHSLRIVHRDLKPQNILLAQRRSGGGSSYSNALLSNGRLTKKTSSINAEGLDDNDDEESAVYTAFEKNSFIPKISDMGLGKQLAGQSSFGVSTLGHSSACGGAGGAGASTERTDVVGAGPGSVGWQAPEVMSLRFSPESARVSLMTRTASTFHSDASNGSVAGDGNSNSRDESMVEASPIIEGTALNSMRTSRSVDIFSLGCIFYCVCVPGSHPFGEWYEREANIMKNNPSIEALMKVSADASDLVKSMIERDPKKRPTAAQVCDHPFFWNATKRLAFLCELSDRLEVDSPSPLAASTKTIAKTAEDESATRMNNIDTLAIERNAAQVVGTSWDKDLDPDLLSNVSRFRTYDPCSVRDCLRLIRNKYHHYDELPVGVKQRIGPHPDDLLRYFESKFPRLVMHCYNVSSDIVVSANDPFATKYGITLRSSLQATPKNNKHDDTNRIENTTSSSVSEIRTKNDILSLSGGQVESFLPHHRSVRPEVKEVDGEKNYYEIVRPQDSIISLSSNKSSLLTPLPSDDLAKNMMSTTPALTTSQILESDVTSDEPADKTKKITTLVSSVEIASQETKSILSDKTPDDLVIWEGSNASKTYQCRGWMRSEDEWIRRSDITARKRDANITRCATDPKFRTRLCNHWDSSGGTFCPMRKKNKCVFAHGPVELRVKEGKRNRWGKLVDKNGNNSNPFHSGGEDTYGAARSIESQRKEEGKWNTKSPQGKGRSKGKQSSSRKRQQT